MIGELFVLIVMSLAILFWIVIGIMAFLGPIRQINFKKENIREILEELGISFGILVLFGSLCAGAIWLAIPTYRLSINRIPAYWEGKHLIPADDEEVYFCTGAKSECYHYDEYCKGLDNCSGMVVKKECSDAEDYGYRPCRICYMVGKKYYDKSR